MKPFSEWKQCFQAMVQHTSVTRQPKRMPGSSISISLFSLNTSVKPKLLENFFSDLAKLMVGPKTCVKKLWKLENRRVSEAFCCVLFQIPSYWTEPKLHAASCL